jgi:hypothetical protein
MDKVLIRVFSVLKNWLEEHTSDFAGERTASRPRDAC